MPELLQPYKELLKNIEKHPEKKIIILTGGRGSGKSKFLAQLANILATIESGCVTLVSRYTMVNANTSVIPEFLKVIEENNMRNFFVHRKNERELFCKQTGSTVRFSGLRKSSSNQTANLKSVTDLANFIIDEAEEFNDEDEFDTISFSVRNKIGHLLKVISMNPTDNDHFVYKRYIENSHRIEVIDDIEIEISTHPEVLHVHTTYFDTFKFLPKTVIDDILSKKENHYEYYVHKIIGKWVANYYSLIKREFIEIIDNFNDFNITNFVIDTADSSSENNNNSESAICAYTKVGEKVIIKKIDGVICDLSDLVNFVLDFISKNGWNRNSTIYVEPKSSGRGLISLLKRKGIKVLEIKNDIVKLGKQTRGEIILNDLIEKKVKYLRSNTSEASIKQITSFPNSKKADRFDVFCYACILSFNKNLLNIVRR